MARGSHISIDGNSSVDQGGGYPQQSKGSKTVRCDLDLQVSWWLIIQRASESHLTPIPRDENGEPHHLCSNGHYSPRAAFRKDKTRASGLDHYCRQCRLEVEERGKVTRKTQLA